MTAERTGERDPDSQHQGDVPWRVRQYRVLQPLLFALVWLLTGCRVVGREHVPKSGPVLVVANHLNNADPVLVCIVTPRPVGFMAKIELFRVPILAQTIRWSGAFPVDRGAADRKAIRTALDRLAAGQVIGMFPEGTRSRDARMKRGLSGVGLLAVRSGAPVVPCAITGSERLGRLWPRPSLTITYGPAFYPALGGGRRVDHQAVVDEMMRRVAALLPPAYRGVYAEADGPTDAREEGA
jgi:1-acyl-sn-glycerol-3-phosphate acyltransferase